MSLQKIGEAMKFKVTSEHECSSLDEARNVFKCNCAAGAVISVWRDHKWVPLEKCFIAIGTVPIDDGQYGEESNDFTVTAKRMG